MSDDIPQAWHLHLERKAIPVSYRGLGLAAGISHEAARRVVRGWAVKDSTLRKVADTLGVDPEVVRDLRSDPPQLDAWEPPASSSRLSHDEREALSRLITLITQDRKDGEGRDKRPAATNAAGHDPAGVMTSDSEVVVPHAGEPTRRVSPRPGRKRRDG